MDKQIRTDMGGNEMKLPEWANWLARDEDGELWAYSERPFKRIDMWDGDDYLDVNREIEETDDTFKHIKFTDEEPTSVKSLIKEFSDKAESLRELGEALTRNWEAEHGKPSVAEYNQWQITQAKAHGYDELPELSNPDIINEPNHYKGKHGIETIDVIRNFGNDDMVAGFYWGNAIKYMTRYRNKNGLEDLKKARRNLDWLIEHTEEEK
jgi:hypothetical protein